MTKQSFIRSGETKDIPVLIIGSVAIPKVLLWGFLVALGILFFVSCASLDIFFGGHGLGALIFGIALGSIVALGVLWLAVYLIRQGVELVRTVNRG